MSYKINSSMLIDEIKKYPVLYDLRLGNGKTEVKKESWEAVASVLFKERWAKFSREEREGLVREIQVKWKSLRDNFTRVLRKEREDEQAGILPNKKRKYIYYEQLLFLSPYTTFRKTYDIKMENFSNDDTGLAERNIQNVIYLDENKSSNDSVQYNITSDENPLQNSSQSISSVQPVQFIQLQPGSSITSTSQVLEDDNNTNSNKRIAAVLEEVVALQKEEKSDDPMGNKKFLLSLLPFMQMLPDDVNLEVRLQLMSVLQTYNSGKSFL